MSIEVATSGTRAGQVEDLANWLHGDSGAQYEHIVDELTSWVEKIEREAGINADRLWHVLAGHIESRWFASDITTMDLQEMAAQIASEYETHQGVA